jgi:hypothetical protein
MTRFNAEEQIKDEVARLTGTKTPGQMLDALQQLNFLGSAPGSLVLLAQRKSKPEPLPEVKDAATKILQQHGVKALVRPNKGHQLKLRRGRK